MESLNGVIGDSLRSSEGDLSSTTVINGEAGKGKSVSEPMAVVAVYWPVVSDSSCRVNKGVFGRMGEGTRCSM